MPYTVLVSKTFQKNFQKLPSSLKNRIKDALKELQEDPYTSCPKCDIKINKRYASSKTSFENRQLQNYLLYKQG